MNASGGFCYSHSLGEQQLTFLANAYSVPNPAC